MSTAIAVLAAGRGARFGGPVPKPLLDLGGRPLLAWALDAAIASGLRPVVLVVGYEGRRVARVAPEGVVVTRARGWKQGIAHSLHAALEVLEGRVQVGAVCVGLGDQPRIGAEAYRRLAAAYDAGALLAVATYDGVRANPVLLARPLWPEVRGLRGDEGARALMRTHPVTEVGCDGTGDPIDVDTPSALDRLDRAQEGSTD